MVVFLIISALISAITSGIIIFTGLSSPQQRTSSQARAAVIQEELSPTPTGEPITPTPTSPPSPTPLPIPIVIPSYITATNSAKQRLFITFNSVSTAKSAIYKVTYSSDGGNKSAQGNIAFASSDKQLTREIVLGVCSGSACTYDTNIKNLKIDVTFTLNDGATTQITYPYAL